MGPRLALHEEGGASWPQSRGIGATGLLCAAGRGPSLPRSRFQEENDAAWWARRGKSSWVGQAEEFLEGSSHLRTPCGKNVVQVSVPGAALFQPRSGLVGWVEWEHLGVLRCPVYPSPVPGVACRAPSSSVEAGGVMRVMRVRLPAGPSSRKPQAVLDSAPGTPFLPRAAWQLPSPTHGVYLRLRVCPILWVLGQEPG